MITLSEILNGGPETAKQWLTKVERGDVPVVTPSAFYGVMEVSDSAARREVSLDWARVALYAYELSARTFPETRDSNADKAMRLRAWFIAKLGLVDGDELL